MIERSFPRTGGRTLSPRKYAIVISLAAILLLSLAGIRYLSLRGTQAVVNGEPIYRVEIEAQVRLLAKKDGSRFSGAKGRQEAREVRKSLLKELISIKVAGQAAQREGIRVSEAEVTNGVSRVKRVYGTNTRFTRALSEQGMTHEILRDRLRNQIAADKIRRRFRAEKGRSAEKRFESWLAEETRKSSIVMYRL